MSYQLIWINFNKRKSKSLYSMLLSITTELLSKKTSVMSTDSVMLWNFSDNRSVTSFELSQEWFNRIMKEYCPDSLALCCQLWPHGPGYTAA